MSIVGVVTIALKAFDSAIELWKKKTPSWEQSQVNKLINEYQYIKALYEVEKRKPQYDETKSDEYNQLARSEDRLLNLRDELLRCGEEVTDKLRSI